MAELISMLGGVRVVGASGATVAGSNSGAFGATARSAAGIYTVAPRADMQWGALDVVQGYAEGVAAAQIAVVRTSPVVCTVLTFDGAAVPLAADRDHALTWYRIGQGEGGQGSSLLLGAARVDADAAATAFIARSAMFIDVTRIGAGIYDLTLAPGVISEEYNDPAIQFQVGLEEGAVGPGGLMGVTVTGPTTIRVVVSVGLAANESNFNVVARRIRA